MRGIERTVRVINRVIDGDGNPVPYDAHFDGESFPIVDHLYLPVGVARIVVQASMYEAEGLAGPYKYKLGVEEFGIPTDPLPLETLPPDLVDAGSFPGKIERRKFKNVISRTEPLSVRTVRGESDGVFPGTYGDRAATR